MDTTTNQGAAGGDNSGGEGTASGQTTNGGGTTAGETVTRAEFERVQRDMHKYKTAAKELQDKAKADNDAKLKADKKWEDLATQRETEAAEAKAEALKLKNSYLNEKKFSAIHAKALALGLREEAASDLEMLDLEKLEVETTNTGKISVLGVDKYVERLKATKPHWFGDLKTPTVDSKGRKITESSDTVSVAQLVEAEKAAKKSGKLEDRTKYQEIHKKYQQQRAANMR